MENPDYCAVCQLRLKEGQMILSFVPAGYGQHKLATPGELYPGTMHVFHLNQEDHEHFGKTIKPYTK